MKYTSNADAVRKQARWAATKIQNDLARHTVKVMKPNMPVDTGFMKRTTESVLDNSRGSPAQTLVTQRKPDGKAGRLAREWNDRWEGAPVFRFSVNGPQTAELQSAVSVPAVYAFWVNLRQGFFEAAINDTIANAPSIVKKTKLG